MYRLVHTQCPEMILNKIYKLFFNKTYKGLKSLLQRFQSVFSQNVRAWNPLASSVGSKLKLGLARLGFGSSFWEKKLGSAHHAFQKARLGSACHILQKSSVQLSLLYHLKKQIYLKEKKELFSNSFANSLRYNP